MKMRLQRRRTTVPVVVLFLSLLCGTFSSAVVAQEQNDANQALTLSTTSETQDIRDATDVQPEEQRRELFWSLVFLMELLKDPPCPPIGPLHDKCKARKEANAANNDSSSSASSSGSYSSNEIVSDSTNSNNNVVQNGSSRMKLWMFIVAGAAMATAFIAAIIGQRRQQARNTHILTGSVARRMGLFQTFCDSALCADERNSSRVVEMTLSMDDYDAIPDNRNSAMV